MFFSRIFPTFFSKLSLSYFFMEMRKHAAIQQNMFYFHHGICFYKPHNKEKKFSLNENEFKNENNLICVGIYETVH